MVLTTRFLIGSVLGFVGGIFFFLASWLALQAPSNYYYTISDYGLTWNDVNFNPELFTIRPIVTLIWGILTIVGALLSILGKPYGNIFCFISGIGGIITASFISIGYISILLGGINISLSESTVADIALALIAGLLLTRSRDASYKTKNIKPLNS